MVVGAKVCELTDGFLLFVCGNFGVSPNPSDKGVRLYVGDQRLRGVDGWTDRRLLV